MKLIIGLGNPGLFYRGSRHNIGSAAVKSLARRQKVVLRKDNSAYACAAKSRPGRESFVLAVPLTFMNLSGLAARELLKKFQVKTQDMLVVCDDLDLELGRIKLRARGSGAGHRGLQSIIDKLGTQEFCRLRLGIGRPASKKGAAGYVLEGFRRAERKPAEEMKERAVSCCLSWLERGAAQTMNIFNSKEQK